MSFDHPRLLWLLLVLVPLSLTWLAGHGRGMRALVALGGEWRKEPLVSVYVFKRFFGHLFFCACVACAVLALARPRWGTRLVSDERIGFELVFVMDLSQSMLAEDTPPSRLEWSRSAAIRLIDMFPEAEIGLVAFRGTARKLVPVTEAHLALKTAVRVMDAGYVVQAGSGIAGALAAAGEAFTGREGKYRAVFVFSDGEAREARAAAAVSGAAEELGRAGIPVIVMAVGTEEGATIPTARGTDLLDSDGSTVVTRRDLERLEDVASASGGTVFRAEGGVPSEQQLERLFRRGEIEAEQGIRLEGRDRFGFTLVMAVLCLSVSVLVRGVRWRDIY